MGRQPAVVQSVAHDPKVLLDPANVPEPTFLSDKYIPFSGAFCGFIIPFIRNIGGRRPFYAGIHVTAATTLVGFGIGWLIEKKNQSYWADRDAILYHYVQLHPEDFPPKERILVGDMLKPWVPCR